MDTHTSSLLPNSKERPILFSGSMVRALLSGTKTQTRRVVKPQPATGQGMVNAAYCRAPHLWLRDGPCESSDPAYQWACPYGQPGDRLWVREEWSTHACYDHLAPRNITARSVHYWAGGHVQTGKRRASMFMPRWASRILLEITEVRAERLQDISRGDAMAEGCPFPNMALGPDPRKWYAELWDSLGGSWEDNPWTWAVSFRVLPSPAEALKGPKQ